MILALRFEEMESSLALKKTSEMTETCKTVMDVVAHVK
jgi:hypothetical protein